MRYRLPESLGGGEFEAFIDYHRVGELGADFVRFDVPGVGLVDIERGGLTEVKPPLPPEPPIGSVVRDKNGRVWVSLQGPTPYVWQSTVGGKERWADLVAGRGPLTLLVPDPFAEPVELPYTLSVGHHTKVRISAPVSRIGPIVALSLASGGRFVSPDMAPATARDLARALWAAADAAVTEKLPEWERELLEAQERAS